jgi:serine protease Do
VIGINSLKIAERGVEGLGFAIPINDARPVIRDLIRYGRVPRPYIGIQMIDLNRLPQYIWEHLHLPSSLEGGAVIREVENQQAAARAGLKAKDVIIAIDGNPVRSASDIRKYLYKQKKIGEKVLLTFFRNGKKTSATVTLDTAPKNLH